MWKLREEPRGGSFYESFSDLIFGTLVLFIVLVMALALQMRKSEARISESTARTTAKVLEHVSKSRFTGAPNQTILYVCHLPVDGVTHMAFLPATVGQGLALARRNGNDPIAALCDLGVSGELTTLPAPGVEAMAGGLTLAVANRQHAVLDHPTAGAVLHVARTLVQRQPGRWNADSLYRALGGMHFDIAQDDAVQDTQVVQLLRDYRTGVMAPGRGMDETAGMLERRLEATREDPPRIRFTCPDQDHIRVGATAFSPQMVRTLLGALKPGRNFYLECVDANGKASAFPDWFESQLLAPLGFDGRVIRDEALQLAKQGGRQ